MTFRDWLRPGQVAAAVAPALALVSPLIASGGDLRITVFSGPLLWLLAGLAALGLALGCALVSVSLVPASPVRTFLQVLILTGCIVVCLDVVAGGHWILSSLTPDAVAALPPPVARLARVAPLAAIFAALFAVFWLIRRHAVSIAVLVALTLFAATVVANPAALLAVSTDRPQVGPAPTMQPPVLYIVLDEALGIEGLQEAPGGSDLAGEIRRVLVGHGFRVFERAFSRHPVSARSIPSTLNFDFNDDRYGTFVSHADRGKVQSRLFARLSEEGYQVVVYGTEHIDFCFDGAERCEVLPSFNPYSPFVGSQDPAANVLAVNEDMKAQMALFLLRPRLNFSYLLYHYLEWLTARYADVRPEQFHTVDAYQFPRWFDRFETDVLSSPAGRAYFAHFLVPHSPYVLNEACNETGRAPVGYSLVEQHGLEGEALETRRRGNYADYLAQYRCALSRIDALLEKALQRPDFRSATIVVQGDHGSRISAGLKVENLTDRDLLDNYSALYAIRRSDLAPGVDGRRTSIQRLSAELFSNLPVDALGPDNPTVVVDSEVPDKVEVRPLPEGAWPDSTPVDTDCCEADRNR